MSIPLTSCTELGVSGTPSMVNVTVPVGVPANPGAVTTAVNVTCWPTVDGFNEDVSVVVVDCEFGEFTVCVGSDPLLGLTLASPLYAAVTECCPAASVEINELRLVRAPDDREWHGRLRLPVDGEGHRARRRPLVRRCRDDRRERHLLSDRRRIR